MVPCLHQGNVSFKRKHIALVVQKPHLPVRAGKLYHLIGGCIGPRTDTCVNWVDLSPLYRVYTKEIFISKGSYGYGENRNVFH